MIKYTQELLKEYGNYCSPKNKIAREVANKRIFLLKKGIYETDINADPFFLSSIIYGPSYISFYTALSFYGLIPERTYRVTCATTGKNKTKEFVNEFSTFTYRDVPSAVFSLDNALCFDKNGNPYYMANLEKAFLDTLYISPRLSNCKGLIEYLFENLRIDEELFFKMDVDKLIEVGKLYKTINHNLLIKFLRSKTYAKQHANFRI